MQRKIEENLAAARANPSEITQLAPANNQIKENIANAQKLLAEFEKLPSITPGDLSPARPLLLRAGSQMGSGRGQPGNPRPFQGRPGTRAGPLRPDRRPRRRQPAEAGAQSVANNTCAISRTGPNAATVGYLLGAVALQAGDPKAAETYFGRILETATEEPVSRADSLPAGNAKFIPPATTPTRSRPITNTSAEFPKGANADDVKYRIASARFSPANTRRR